MTVLVLGLSMLDGELLRRLATDGRLPNIARLLDDGHWTAVRSTTDHGAASVWTSFATGLRPDEHGIVSEWQWDPDRLAVGRPLHDQPPSWACWPEPVGLLDVPVARPRGPGNGGFEVTGWGPHDLWLADPRGPGAHVEPPHLAPLLGPHPFTDGTPPVTTADDWPSLRALHADCVRGAEARTATALRLVEATRPDLALVVFTEFHNAYHALWHTLEPRHPAYADVAFPPDPPDLSELARVLDAQVGALAAAVDGPPPVLFALHGARPARGFCDVLDAVLAAWGFAQPARPPARALLSARVKAALPPSLKAAWYRRAPKGVTESVARLNLVAPVDWATTRAFALPGHQQGQVRVNLRGRERQGVVAPADYAGLLDELEAQLRALARRRDGAPLVQDVLRMTGPDGTPPARAADLVVVWTPEAAEPGLEIDGVDGRFEPRHRNITAHQTPGGWCLVPRALGPGLGDEVASTELATRLRALARA